MTHSYVPWLNSNVPWHTWRSHHARKHSWPNCVIPVPHDSFIRAMPHWYVSWLIHMCHDSIQMCYDTYYADITRASTRGQRVSFRWPVTSLCVPWLIRMCHDSFVCAMTCWYVRCLSDYTHERVSHETWLVDMCDFTHSCVTWLIHVWHDSFIRDMTHSYVTWLVTIWLDSFMCEVTHSCVTWLVHVWLDSFICDVTYLYVKWLIHMWHDSFMCDLTHL